MIISILFFVGGTYKDLEEVTKKGPVDVDDQNVLNLIAKAIISRRTAIADDEELEPTDESALWDD
jgi:hypothetical protein